MRRKCSGAFLGGVVGLCFTVWVGFAYAEVASELEAVNEGDVLDIATDEILLRLSLTNTTETDRLFLGYRTPLAGFESDLFVVERNGQPVDYIGKFVLRAPPTQADWIRLEPGETLSMVFDLATAYDITQPGAYTVRYRGVQSASEAASVRLPENYAGASARLESNPVSLQVVGSRHAESRSVSPMDRSARYYECSPSQLEYAYAAETGVAPACNAAAEAALSDPSFVVTWFGDPSFASAVADRFSCISGGSSGNQYYCDTCGGNVIAYTYLGGGPIWLCELFFQGYGAGTILHEVAHHCGARDNGYGCGTAQSLARSDPNSAYNNADNYRCAAGL